MCFTRPHILTLITVEPKSVLTLYCVPNVLFLTSVGVQGLVLSCPLFGGFTGLEVSNIEGGGGEAPRVQHLGHNKVSTLI